MQCSDHDLDHGTECLELVRKYADARVCFVPGSPEQLFKVTYPRDLHAIRGLLVDQQSTDFLADVDVGTSIWPGLAASLKALDAEQSYTFIEQPEQLLLDRQMLVLAVDQPERSASLVNRLGGQRLLQRPELPVVFLILGEDDDGPTRLRSELPELRPKPICLLVKPVQPAATAPELASLIRQKLDLIRRNLTCLAGQTLVIDR